MKKSDRTRARILAAAGSLLAKKDLRNIRTAELAAKAGLSEGAIFRYFPTKSHIFAAVIEQLLQRFARWMEEALCTDGGTPRTWRWSGSSIFISSSLPARRIWSSCSWA